MSDESKLPKQPLQLPVDAVAAPLDDPFAAGLRGFGPLGIVAILAIVLTGNVYWNLESDVAHLLFK